MNRATLPVGFSVLMAVVVLAGVGTGYLVWPHNGEPSSVAVVQETPAVPTVPVTVPTTTTTTTTTVAVPLVTCTQRGQEFRKLDDVSFIAGVNLNLLTRVRSWLGGKATLIALGENAAVANYVPDGPNGVLLIPADQRLPISGLRNMRVILYSRSNDAVAPTAPPNWLLLRVSDASSESPLLGNESFVAGLITNGVTVETCPPLAS